MAKTNRAPDLSRQGKPQKNSKCKLLTLDKFNMQLNELANISWGCQNARGTAT